MEHNIAIIKLKIRILAVPLRAVSPTHNYMRDSYDFVAKIKIILRFLGYHLTDRFLDKIY